MNLKKNVLAGLISTIWTALLALAVIPIYLRYLGIEAYGLIAVFATIQILLSLLDMGLATTINREIARRSGADRVREIPSLLHSVAVAYWLLAATGAIVIILLTPLISTHWLQTTHLSTGTVRNSLLLMALVFAFRFPIELYQGALMGMERMVATSMVSTLMGTLTSAGAVGILAFASPTIEAFFSWQLFCSALHTAILHRLTWKSMPTTKLPRFHFTNFIGLAKFTTAISGITLTALALSQFDKILLSRLLKLEDFGLYILSTSVVGSLYIFVTPFFRGIYPRLSILVSSGDTENIINTYRKGTWLLSSLIFPVSTTLIFFPNQLLYAWTQDHSISANGAPLVTLMALGSALHGIMHMPYALQLAYGKTNLPLRINGILLVIMPPSTYALTSIYGTMGGAFSWLLFNVLYFIIGVFITHRQLLNNVSRLWLLQDVLSPFLTSMFFGFIGKILIDQVEMTTIHTIVFACILVSIAMVACIYISPHRHLALKWLIRSYQVEST